MKKGVIIRQGSSQYRHGHPPGQRLSSHLCSHQGINRRSPEREAVALHAIPSYSLQQEIGADLQYSCPLLGFNWRFSLQAMNKGVLMPQGSSHLQARTSNRTETDLVHTCAHTKEEKKPPAREIEPPSGRLQVHQRGHRCGACCMMHVSQEQQSQTASLVFEAHLVS